MYGVGMETVILYSRCAIGVGAGFLSSYAEGTATQEVHMYKRRKLRDRVDKQNQLQILPVLQVPSCWHDSRRLVYSMLQLFNGFFQDSLGQPASER